MKASWSTNSAAEQILIARRRKAIELVECNWTVTKACAHVSISRSQFYRYKARYEKYGEAGLSGSRAKPANRTCQSIIDKVCNLAIERPKERPNDFARILALEGINLSIQTIQNMLNKHDIGTVRQRVLYHVAINALHYLSRFTPDQIQSCRDDWRSLATHIPDRLSKHCAMKTGLICSLPPDKPETFP